MKAETDLELQATGKLAIDLAMQKMKDSLNRMVLTQTTHHDDDDEEEDADEVSDDESDDSDDDSLLLAQVDSDGESVESAESYSDSEVDALA